MVQIFKSTLYIVVYISYQQSTGSEFDGCFFG
jgi:hypothetical protein